MKSKGVLADAYLLDELSAYVASGGSAKPKPLPAEYMDLNGDGQLVKAEDLAVALEGYQSEARALGEKLVWKYTTTLRLKTAQHLGGASHTTDSAGDLIGHQRFHAYGKVASRKGQKLYRGGYIGKDTEPDPDLGLQRIGARYYAPGFGRWITPDPLIGQSPKMMVERVLESNLYSYAGNEPIGVLDGSGKEATPAEARAARYEEYQQATKEVVMSTIEARYRAAPWYRSYRAVADQTKAEWGISSRYLYESAGAVARALVHRERTYHHYLAEKLVDHYMDASGSTVRLSQQEAIDLNLDRLSVTVGSYEKVGDHDVPRRNAAFDAILGEMGDEARGSGKDVVRNVSFKGAARSKVAATLGRFTVYYTGELRVDKDGGWSFSGKMQFYDDVNFESRKDRTKGAEGDVESAQKYLAGTPFAVISDMMNIHESSDGKGAHWNGEGVSQSFKP